MFDPEFEDMTVEELKRFIASQNEKDYLIVDVRQPGEYTSGHIPGAGFTPLGELVSDLSGLPGDKDLIFYCHSGGRSLAAASMVSEEGITDKKIFNLKGGILAWDGQTLTGFPRIQVFDSAKTPEELLLTAMDLEKGAWRFYTYFLDNLAPDPIISTLERLSKAEIAHARTVYGFWKNTKTDPPSFDELYSGLKGEILEGGETLEDVLGSLENIQGNLRLNVIELALHMEYAAYDLYRTMAGQAADPTVRDDFLSIAQAEKSHMRTLIKALERC